VTTVTAIPKLSRRKRFVFAAVAMTLSLVAAFGAALGADIYLHGKFERSAGVNIWGYRGPTLGRKRAGEIRVAFLGGSTVFGYGVTWDQAIPAALERRLQARHADRVIHVVNLGYNNEGAFAFLPTLTDYQYMKFDIVCLYEGYNDHGTRPNVQVFRRESPVFRAFGYLPLLPVALREKAFAFRYGDISAAYAAARGEPDTRRVVFTPNLAQRAGAAALGAAADVADSLERQLGKLSPPDQRPVFELDTDCGRFNHYCTSVAAAVDYVVRQEKRVLVIAQPYMGDFNVAQQRQLSQMLTVRFPSEARLRYVDLGDSIDLKDRSLSYDGMHLTGAGNDRIAAALVADVEDMLKGL
jgi:lysophospholipase L1-like esterase